MAARPMSRAETVIWVLRVETVAARRGLRCFTFSRLPLQAGEFLLLLYVISRSLVRTEIPGPSAAGIAALLLGATCRRRGEAARVGRGRGRGRGGVADDAATDPTLPSETGYYPRRSPSQPKCRRPRFLFFQATNFHLSFEAFCSSSAVFDTIPEPPSAYPLPFSRYPLPTMASALEQLKATGTVRPKLPRQTPRWGESSWASRRTRPEWNCPLASPFCCPVQPC